MALALGVMRFQTDVFVVNNAVDGATQGAVIAVSQEEKNSVELEDALKDAHSAGGTLVEMVTDDVRIGTGDAVVKEGDAVTVHYIGTTQDGVKFDSSYDRGIPFIFTVGDGKVIEGWEKGLIGMKVGGQRILVIPGSMAYGNMQVGAIPPNATLVFAVELLEIK
ncbi:FKBP-type peptidyl-prolyl cis-trans isomerase [Candidatus Kaiserbacteria bacterium]|nr:MAG: FKBP-type peptidyl-prolyl cis-trans isomerase [Candidatus Kaiserbacteria bacterium]